MTTLRPTSSHSLAKPLVLAALLAGLLIAALSISCGGGSDEAPVNVAKLSADALDVAPTEVPATQAQPLDFAPLQDTNLNDSLSEAILEPPAPENRADCSAIRGTEYRSLEEREWYGANCVRTATGSPPGSVPSAAGARPSGGQSPTGDRLVIPAAGVNAEVWSVRVPFSGLMPDPVGYFNALSYDFSALPGLGGSFESGNLVLAGHVDCGKCYNGGAGAAVFWSVRTLKPGDTAQYRASDGRMANYVVTSSRSLAGGTDGASIVASGNADMTLITCTGSFSGGEYNLRHVVAFRKI